MPVPKRKTSKSRRDKRSANKGLAFRSVAECLTCQAPVNPHQVCHQCGYYKGVKVLQTKEDRQYKRGKALEARDLTRRAQAPAAETEQGSSES